MERLQGRFQAVSEQLESKNILLKKPATSTVATAGNLHFEVAQVRCVACSPFVSTQRGAMLAKSAKTHLGAPASLQHARPPGGVHTQFKQGPPGSAEATPLLVDSIGRNFGRTVC